MQVIKHKTLFDQENRIPKGISLMDRLGTKKRRENTKMCVYKL